MKSLLAFWLCSLLALAGALHATSAATDDELKVVADFDVAQPVTIDTAISLRLSRELREGEGRIAVIVGRTDVTSLFIVDSTRFIYSPHLVTLPVGESPLVVFRVDPEGTWTEIARFALHVREKAVATTTTPAAKEEIRESKVVSVPVKAVVDGAGPSSKDDAALPTTTTQPTSTAPAAAESPAERHRFGFDKMNYVPSVTVAVKSQPAQFNFPDSTRPSERATFTDATLQFSMRNEMARGSFASQTSFDFAGSTFQQEALRFGTLGAKAPQIDLSSYLLQFQLGPAKLVVGHTSFGAARHLVDSFSSRGVTVTVPVAKRFDFSVAAMNGTNVVGYGNFFGLGKSKHQLQSATLGVELLTKRPGGLRLEFAGVRAYIQALNSFSQGSVNDVERSQGGSFRLIATDKAGRFKFDGGFTRSQYRNPADPLLYQGTNTIAVPFLTRNARYVDVSFDVLRGVHLTKSKPLSLNLAMRHEQVDPLFKSLGASAQADKLQNDFQLSGSLGEISFQAGYGRFNDNLRHIASILQSLTRSKQYSIALPAAALWGGTSSSSKFLPRLSYSRSETHQFGAAIPVNGGFETDPGSVPDQFSINQTFSSDWQFKKVTLGSSYNRSFTNNQQLGREQSDFLNQTVSGRVGFNPTTKLNLTFDLTRDSANDLESAKRSRTWRVGTTASWNFNKYISWTGGISNTIAGDRARTNDSRNTEFETQFSYHRGIERGGLRKIQTQTFIRYADRYARSRDLVFQTSNLTRLKIFNAGLNITFF